MSAFSNLYVGAMNDALFIIDTPPRPSNDYPAHDRDVNVIAAMEQDAKHAHLFAAAPDLYAAADAVANTLEMPGLEHMHPLVAKLRAALSKARGES